MEPVPGRGAPTPMPSRYRKKASRPVWCRIPLRNIAHAVLRLARVKDIEAGRVRLVAAFISRLDENSLAKLAWDLGWGLGAAAGLSATLDPLVSIRKLSF